MAALLEHLGDALRLSFAMFWEVLWPLALGFLLSAVVEALVSKRTVSRVLGRDTVRSVALATGFGAASSSCSYAAVAVARSLVRKGATLANAIIFEFASTNLVFELGLVLLILLGWQFLSAELLGGLLMVVLLALIFRLTLRPALVERARVQAGRGLPGRMEGHGDMDMAVTGGPFLRRLVSPRGLTAVGHSYFMGIASVWSDLLIGFLAAGALGAWVPDGFWGRLFLSGSGAGAEVWGALLGPLVAVMSFVCSVGNVPLAAILWSGGMSFGGVISFIFADLIIIPIISIHRRYYTGRVSAYLVAVSYATMALAGLAVGLLFRALGATPTNRRVTVFESAVSWNSTTVLDIAALAMTALLAIRFLRTGGVAMLRAMNRPAGEHDHAAMGDGAGHRVHHH